MTNEKNIVSLKGVENPEERAKRIVEEVADKPVTPVETFRNRIKSLLKKDKEIVDKVSSELIAALDENLETDDVSEQLELDFLKDVEFNIENLFFPTDSNKLSSENNGLVLEKAFVVTTNDEDLLDNLESMKDSIDLKFRISEYFNEWIQSNILSQFQIEEFGKMFELNVFEIEIKVDKEKGTITILYKTGLELIVMKESVDTEETLDENENE